MLVLKKIPRLDQTKMKLHTSHAAQDGRHNACVKDEGKQILIRTRQQGKMTGKRSDCQTVRRLMRGWLTDSVQSVNGNSFKCPSHHGVLL